MSESSEEKTKRKLIEKLLVYPWVYQVTLFFEDYDHSQELPEVLPKLRTKIRKAFPNDPIFARTALKYHSATRTRIAYETYYCLKPIPELKRNIEKWMSTDRVRSRTISPEKRLQSAKSMRKGISHDLKGYFHLDKVNRHRLLNRKKLPAPNFVLHDLFLAHSYQKSPSRKLNKREA